MSVLEGCPFCKGHYDDVTFKLPLTVLKRLVTKNRHTHASELFKLIYSIETLVYSNVALKKVVLQFISGKHHLVPVLYMYTVN